MKKQILAWLIAGVTALTGTACQAKGTVSVNGEKVAVNDGLYALFQTSQGDILVRLEYKKAPMTVANFVALAEGTHPLVAVRKNQPFYDGLIFHRCIKNFMIQGGDPDGTGMGGPGYQFPDEFEPTLKHDTVGILSMANAGPGTNGSQFFITEVPTPWLDNRHSVFGQVVAGHAKMAVITSLPQNASNKPNEDVVLKKLEIVRVGKDAEAFDAPKIFAERKDTVEKEKKERNAAADKIGQERLAQFSFWSDGGTVDQAAYSKAYAQWNAKATPKAGGLKVLVVKEGTGEVVKAGNQVSVHYVGYLANGTYFDASVKSVAQLCGGYDPRREPYEAFTVTAGPEGQVIEGWKQGLMGLKKGTHAKLIIPPTMGYGDRDMGIIPPNSTLVFDVWIEDVQ
jgi:cyclophilin family peptidyl-prolyl cis-trans isomerase